MDLQKSIGDIIQASTDFIRREDGDYIGEDGLLVCGKCHTPKQVRVVFFGQEVCPPCLCDCAAKSDSEREERARQSAMADWLVRARRECFDEERMTSWNFANDDMSNAELSTAMRRYADNFSEFLAQGKGLLLCGSVGTGKTYAACEVLNAVMEAGVPAKFTSFAKLLNELQSSYDKQGVIDELSRFKLVALDDLGVERTTEYAQEQVYNIVDARVRSGLPMIITTNLTLDAIKNPRSMNEARIYDRILSRCHPIEVKGVSRRRKEVMADYERTKNLLGL
jgi:DNA replication protein DnaC